jgi:hypothetical protein
MQRLAISALGLANALPGNKPAFIKIATATIARVLSTF